MNWKEAYDNHGVKCGQGLERFADSLWMEKFRISAYPTDKTAMEYAEKDVCKHMFTRMNFNYAMNTRIAPMHMPDIYPKPHVSLQELSTPQTWCYVRASLTCSMPHGHHVPGTGLSIKLVEPGEDVALRDLPMEKILDLAKTNILDLGELLPNAAHIMWPHDKYDPDNVTSEDLSLVKAFNRPTMIMSTDVKKARLFVQGDNVVKFQPGWPQGSVPLEMPLQ
uniref:Uncharacterized protein n=1 Tax=Alexandrium catenella TaxID=2925 RepID=A0A7S1RV43_ALECA